MIESKDGFCRNIFRLIFIALTPLDRMDQLRQNPYQDTQITLYWIPAHKGVLGNAAADKAAKEATRWAIQERRGHIVVAEPVDLRNLVASAKTKTHRRCLEKWSNDWENAKNVRGTF